MPTKQNLATISNPNMNALKPMWSWLFNLGLAALLAVVGALIAFASTNDLRDGGTLIAVPVGIVAWFLGDILRWRGRYPMRLFLMVPIFVALACSVSIRFMQKANQRRMAWNSMIEAGATMQFETVKGYGWILYEEGIFLPDFLESWFGPAVFANSANVSIPLSSFAVGSQESQILRNMNFDRSPTFRLEISDSRNEAKLDLDAFSKICNCNHAEGLEVSLHSPTEEAIRALKAIQRPYYLYLSGVLSEKAMRHLPVDSSLQYIVLKMNDPPDQVSWLNFLPASPSCVVVVQGSVSAASLQTIDPERPLCKLFFNGQISLEENAAQELAKLSKAEFITMRHFGDFRTKSSLHAMCKSPVSMSLGPIRLDPEAVQLLIENEARTSLHLLISSIDSTSFRQLAEVKCLKSIDIGFDCTEQDIQSIALFPAEVDITIRYDTNLNQASQVAAAINNRKR